jgi:hypothetical protein
MKRNSSNFVIGFIIFGLFLVIFCSMLVFTTTVMGIGYAIQSSIQQTPLSGVSLSSSTPESVALNTEIAETLETLETPVPTVIENTPTPLPTKTVPSATATETFIPTITETPLPPTVTFTPTVDVTALTSDMMVEIQTLYDSGIITTIDGTYHQIPNYSKSWNQLDVYEQTATDFTEISDFVLRADASWQVDGSGGEWRESGCGIIFRQDENLNHYLVYYSLDGRARLWRDLEGGTNLLGRTTIYDIDRENGYGKIMIVVEGDYINLFFNEKEVFRKRDTWLQTGALSLTTISGNMNGFGTQCNLSNIELWEINH